MSKIYYKEKKVNYRKYLKTLGAGFILLGLGISLYIFSPLILWQIYSAPALTSQNMQAPIPRSTVVNPSMIGSLLSSAKNSITGIDYTNAANWFPGFKAQASTNPSSSYSISIPSLNIKNADVSTSDYDLICHLVNYQGTAIPPNSGNAVVFGHSTLPQLYKVGDYKTIFANALNLKTGDQIIATINGVMYTYKVFNIYIIDADDTSVFTQTYDNSYLTLVTCTPPGTVWKRLVIKSRLEKI